MKTFAPSLTAASPAASGPHPAATMADNRPGTVVQRKLQAAIAHSPHQAAAQQQAAVLATSARPNYTGLPDQLKDNIERISGYSLDDVRVHYNSSKPAELQALAYAQGTDIYLGPGQEQYLPHEAWHVVQQKQGRVRPTLQVQGVGVDDSAALEREADKMGATALTSGGGLTAQLATGLAQPASPTNVVQMGGAVSSMRGGGASTSSRAVVPHQIQVQPQAQPPLPDHAFGDLDPQPKAYRPSKIREPKLLEGQLQAQAYIDAISEETLTNLKLGSLLEAAKSDAVHDHLVAAMAKWAAKQPNPAMYADLNNKQTFGLAGNCMDVSPIFGYLLNKIYASKAVVVFRDGGAGGGHTVLATEGGTPTYIDATWRQGTAIEQPSGLENGPESVEARSNREALEAQDPRQHLPMVRTSTESPTLQDVDQAVRSALALRG